MHRRASFPMAMLVLAAGLAGCESPAPAGQRALPPVLPEHTTPANTADLSTEQLRQAAVLYTAKCARCHKFYDPASYSEGEWRKWMVKMSRKARLTADQDNLLSRYLKPARDTSLTGAGTPNQSVGSENSMPIKKP